MGIEGKVNFNGNHASNAISDSVDVRCALGETANIPVDILWKLARDEHPDVRYSLAENHNIPIEILRALCHDDNPYVAHRAERTISRLGACNEAVAIDCQNVLAIAS